MKFLLLCLIIALAGAASGASLQKRLTCELAGVSIMGNTIGEAGCLAHCLALGHLGGYCDSHNVCHCRH